MMVKNSDVDDRKAKRICFTCVGEAYLSEQMKQSGEIEKCSYCGQTAESYAITTLAERIETAFQDHFYRTPDQPNSLQLGLMADSESRYDWYRDGAPILDAIEEVAKIPAAAAQDVQNVLDIKHGDVEMAQMGEETEFSSESYYEERRPSDDMWQEEWRTFEKSLKTEARFFSRIAAALLTSVFGAIDELGTDDGRALIQDAGPQLELDHLYRARVFQSEDRLKEALCRPDLHIGSPPARLASAGRMNARGISVFYGATEGRVAIAEVRPPVGSRVAVARFNIIRRLRLLDLTCLEHIQDEGSVFDPSLKERLERVAFLQSLGQRMTKAVMPDDEAFEYLATQAIADFLATENNPRLDGILFPSAQAEHGRNVVLFHKAARVESLKFPDGTEIEAGTGYETEDGWEMDYTVSEQVPAPPPQSLKRDDDEFSSLLPHTGPFPNLDDDYRESALQLDQKSVVVHQIEWLQYKSTSFEVDRHRFEKRDWYI